ncbi:MAG: GGDEF domain-containing protein [Arcobacter sp.]|nr:MAG: GGDEF domain-containing protein [Arcobacter sp.]
MDAIKEITKSVLTTLKDNNLEVTPENYFKEFKKQADISAIDFDELKFFDKLVNELTNNEIASSLYLESFKDLSQVLSKRASDDEIKDLLNIFDDILAPSVNFIQKDDIDNFISKLSKEPRKLLKKDTIRRLHQISRDRVALDREVLRNKTDDIIKITTLMEKYFQKTLIESSNSTQEIVKIKDELRQLNISDSSQRELGVLQGKLIDTIFNIENSMQKNLYILDQNKSKFEDLNQTIEKLQKELKIAKEEKSTDFLTDILNRRAYQEEVEKIEKKHDMFDAQYAIVFIDIDHFKEVNDTYGHACGDVILKAFASILKGLTRQEDVISRYGGEEFISLINYKNKDEIAKYIYRLKRIIKTNYFVYKDTRIHVRFSGGIAFRDNYTSYIDAKKNADKLLYEAKNSGRDKVILDDGTEI